MERYCPLSASTCSRSPRAEISVVCWPLVIDTGPDLGDLPMGPPYKTGLVHLTYFYTTALFPFLKTLYTDAVNRRHQSETSATHKDLIILLRSYQDNCHETLKKTPQKTTLTLTEIQFT